MGPYISGLHAECANILAEAGKQAGYTTFRESCIPQLQQVDSQGNVVDAILDVEMDKHNQEHGMLLYVSVRHPAAEGIVRRAAECDGHAAALAVEQKAKRYPAAFGRVVTPCIIETFGRTEPHLDQLLVLLDGLARKQKRTRTSPTPWRKKWALQLELTVARGIARGILAAGASPSVPLDDNRRGLENAWKCIMMLAVGPKVVGMDGQCPRHCRR